MSPGTRTLLGSARGPWEFYWARYSEWGSYHGAQTYRIFRAWRLGLRVPKRR